MNKAQADKKSRPNTAMKTQKTMGANAKSSNPKQGKQDLNVSVLKVFRKPSYVRSSFQWWRGLWLNDDQMILTLLLFKASLNTQRTGTAMSTHKSSAANDTGDPTSGASPQIDDAQRPTESEPKSSGLKAPSAIKEVVTGNVKVFARFRPLNQRELDTTGNETSCQFRDPQTVALMGINAKTGNQEPIPYNFDYVFDMSSTQQQVYEVAVIPVVDGVLNGYNGTILAYG